MSGKGGAAGTVARRPRAGADILGRQLMVREGSSHEGNLLSSFSHSSILGSAPPAALLLLRRHSVGLHDKDFSLCSLLLYVH